MDIYIYAQTRRHKLGRKINKRRVDEKVDLNSGTNILHLHSHEDFIFLCPYFESTAQTTVSGLVN